MRANIAIYSNSERRYMRPPPREEGHIIKESTKQRELVAASPFFILSPKGTVEVVVTAGATRRVNIQSDRHHRQTAGQMPLLSPNQQCQSTRGTKCGGRPVQGVWGDRSPPVGSRGEAPVDGLGTKSPRS